MYFFFTQTPRSVSPSALGRIDEYTVQLDQAIRMFTLRTLTHQLSPRRPSAAQGGHLGILERPLTVWDRCSRDCCRRDGPVESGLDRRLGDPKPPNSRCAIRPGILAVDVDVRPGGQWRWVQPTTALAVSLVAPWLRSMSIMGSSADRVRGRAPWRGCPNRRGTRRRLAVAAIEGSISISVME